MAVTKADKADELQTLESTFRGAESAILVDYKGLNVPQVTELRRRLSSLETAAQTPGQTPRQIVPPPLNFDAWEQQRLHNRGLL